MHKINTTTKKFSEAVTIDLGQLPTVDTRIDFILTDGTNPVIAENKTFTLTIGTVEGTLYKTDDDTVSYRYLKFDNSNVADSLVITMTMDGVEILNDTVSLTYQTSGGFDTSVLDKKLDAPATPGTAGQVLTKTANGAEWADAPSTYTLPPATPDTLGGVKVGRGLSITEDGTLSATGASGTSQAEWGGIGGTLSNQSDLKEALEAKAEKSAVDAHVEDSSIHVTSEEKDAWDAKAAGDHLHTGKYVPLTEEGHILGSYFLRGSLSTGGPLSSNGYVSAHLGFKRKNVDLDDIYAPISHKHAMGDITGLPASGGTAGQVLTKTETGSEWDNLPDENDYLCFTAVQNNSTVGLNMFGTLPTINLEYSVDKKTWTEYTWNGDTGATITLVNIGDKVWWRGNNTAFSLDDANAYYFTMSGSIEASGNIMSLLDKTCKSVTIPTAYCFYMLFGACASLKKAPKLPATTLANWCYFGTFHACSSLIEAPELPAITLAEHCYDWMFKNCITLTKAPDLPATTMVNSCYKGMFDGCASLTKAPELPATTLASYCYENMFYGCSKLNRVKVPFTSWGNDSGWLSGASATGVFECPSALDCSTRDASHVPAGWTIVRTDSPKSITSPTTASSEATYQVSPNTPSVPVVTVSSALTLNSSTVDSGSVAYAEIVLDVASGATVTAGTNLTLVDTPTAGKRNICVCRWSNGVCKLYVTIVEDLPQA